MSQSVSLHLQSVPFETTKVSVSIETDDFYFSYAETKKLSYKTTETDNFHFDNGYPANFNRRFLSPRLNRGFYQVRLDKENYTTRF